MLDRFWLSLATGVVILLIGCGGNDKLEQPFSTLIPQCETTRHAPEAHRESMSSREEPNLQGIVTSAARFCRGENNLHLTMSIYVFVSESEARLWVNEPRPRNSTGPTPFQAWDADYLSLSEDVDDLSAFEFQSFDFAEDEGTRGIEARFRVGRFGGRYLSQSEGPITFIQGAQDFLVDAEPYPFMVEALIGQTIRNWPESLR